ncbi:hypothetical protein HYALB_00004154 [Hymenoscyphus albidus]|uniref:Uncharacterized protein n=1 Tax=Hymenoscyphus albidus TaxID=595503 RepID=A0A9N9PTE4_9HELO|nr:hypothetical protein HYALB_00004154 [Hymenoscyphus albidus]
MYSSDRHQGDKDVVGNSPDWDNEHTYTKEEVPVDNTEVDREEITEVDGEETTEVGTVEATKEVMEEVIMEGVMEEMTEKMIGKTILDILLDTTHLTHTIQLIPPSPLVSSKGHPKHLRKSKIQRGAEGFKVEDQGQKAKLLANLKAILAQEELHAINANTLLENQGVGRIHPCKYKFPAENLNDAIALASKFTDLVLGTLQEVEENLAANDVALIRPVASVIGQEGEQNGYFRFYNDKVPSELPFLTTATREWAWSALNQNFIVPSSCTSSDINSIPYTSFPKLTVDYKELQQSLKPTDINFSFKIPAGSTLSDYGSQADNLSELKLGFINQQNTPVEGEIQGVEVEGTTVTFSALFDYKSGTFGNGLTIAVLVSTNTTTTDPRVVSGSTVFGPALIDIN